MTKAKRPSIAVTSGSVVADDDNANRSGSFRVGLNVNSRVHRACTTCRRMKMRCEGPADGACIRCQRTDQECVFEAPASSSAKQSEGQGQTVDSRRIEAVEAQLASMHECMRQILAATQAQTAAAGPIASTSMDVLAAEPTEPAASWPMNAKPSMPLLRRDDTGTTNHSPGLYALTQTSDDAFSPHDAQVRSMRGAQADAISVRSSPPSAPQFSQSEVSATPISMTTQSYGRSPTRFIAEQNVAVPIDKSTAEGLSELGSRRDAQNATSSHALPTSHQTRWPKKRPRLDEDGLPDEEGLGAPIEALRGLAEAAARHGVAKSSRPKSGERDAAYNIRRWISGGDDSPMRMASNAASRFNSPDPTSDEDERVPMHDDLITKGLLGERVARHLWAVFARGCPRFVAACFVEDSEAAQNVNYDTDSDLAQDKEWQVFDATRRRSSFLFATILAVGAQVDFVVHAESYDVCLREAQSFAQQTMVMRASQVRIEDVMALNLLASYCDYGWLLCGQAVRIAQELHLDECLGRLKSLAMKHPTLFTSSPATARPFGPNVPQTEADGVKAEARNLAHSTRVWFFTFLLEHQISYGAGRLAVLHRDLVKDCRHFLQLTRHFDRQYDARFVATLELMVLREKHFDCLAPFNEMLCDAMMDRVQALNDDLNAWLDHWQAELVKSGHEENSFMMASLHLQCATAKLYLTSTSLRSDSPRVHVTAGSESPRGARWESASSLQRSLVMQSVRAALEALRVGVSSEEYLRLLTWAPHYTVVTLTFAAVFVLKAIRLYSAAKLFSSRKHQQAFYDNAQTLAMRLCAIVKAHRYGAVIFKLLHRCTDFTQAGFVRKAGVRDAGTSAPRTPVVAAGSSVSAGTERPVRAVHMSQLDPSTTYAPDGRFMHASDDPIVYLDSNQHQHFRTPDFAFASDLLPPGYQHFEANAPTSVNMLHIADERFGSFDQLLRDLGLENGTTDSFNTLDM